MSTASEQLIDATMARALRYDGNRRVYHAWRCNGPGSGITLLYPITVVTWPMPLQHKAFDLVGSPCK